MAFSLSSLANTADLFISRTLSGVFMSRPLSVWRRPQANVSKHTLEQHNLQMRTQNYACREACGHSTHNRHRLNESANIMLYRFTDRQTGKVPTTTLRSVVDGMRALSRGQPSIKTAAAAVLRVSSVVLVNVVVVGIAA